LHLIRATYEPGFATVTLVAPHDYRNIPTATFAFPADTASAAEWFSKFLGYPVMVRHDPAGIPDDLIANRPTVISTASLQTVCEWFPGLTIPEARLRFRATLELDCVPPFWEDQLFGAELRSVVRFHIGEVAFEGSYPCIRCPIPARDSHTGADTIGFQKHFAQQRRAHLPRWSHADRFEHSTASPPTRASRPPNPANISRSATP
jgi:uncharacterized protein YcbX